MPKKESKIMSMLENRGVIRKVDSEKESSPANSVSAENQFEPDIKAIIDMPDSDVKPAARQPVPGISAPVFSPDQADDKSDALEVEYTSQDVSADEYESALGERPVTPNLNPPFENYAHVDSQPAPSPSPASSYSNPAVSASVYSGFDAFNDDAPVPELAPEEVATRPDSYTDRYLSIEELYDALSLRSRKQETIYLIEEYLQTLPDALPDTARRDIVGKLLAASGFDYDLLMGDGVLRVKMLKEYAERFAEHTDDYIASRQAEVDEYEQHISRIRQLINNRRELHKKQFYTIEAEAQRLKEILTFISG